MENTDRPTKLYCYTLIKNNNIMLSEAIQFNKAINQMFVSGMPFNFISLNLLNNVEQPLIKPIINITFYTAKNSKV